MYYCYRLMSLIERMRTRIIINQSADMTLDITCISFTFPIVVINASEWFVCI